MVRVAAHPHADQLDERRPPARAGARGRPHEGGRDLVGIGAVDRDPGNAVARRFVGERADGGLIRDGRRERRLVVLHAEDRRQAPHRAQIDRLVPLAERRPAFADERHRDAAVPLLRERHREPGDGERADGQRRCRRQDPRVEVADVEVLAIHRRTGLRHLRRERQADGRRVARHRDRRAEVANQRGDDVAAPALRRAVLRTAAQADRGGVDGLLAQRAKSLPLERRGAVAHIAAGEEQLQPVVRRARERHPAEDLAPFLRRQRQLDGGAVQESVARVDQLVDGGRPALGRGDAWRGVREIGRRHGQGPAERRRQRGTRVGDAVRARQVARGGLERRRGGGRGERIAIEDERAEPRRERRHDPPILAVAERGLYEGLDLGRGPGTGGAGHLASVREHRHRRDRADAEALAEIRQRVRVDLQHEEPAAVRRGDSRQLRRDHPARRAPRRPEIDDDRERRLRDRRVEGRGVRRLDRRVRGGEGRLALAAPRGGFEPGVGQPVALSAGRTGVDDALAVELRFTHDGLFRIA